MRETDPQAKTFFGISAIGFAMSALLLAVVHLSLGPFTPQEPVEKTIVDTAVAIKDYAKQVLMNDGQPVDLPVKTRRRDADWLTDAATLGLAGVALVLALVALIRREPRRNALIGFFLGAGVLTLSWLQWIAILICGMLLLVAIVANLENILG